MGERILLFVATGTRGCSLTEGGDGMWVALDRARGKEGTAPLNVRLLNVRLLWAAAFSVVGFPALQGLELCRNSAPLPPPPTKVLQCSFKIHCKGPWSASDKLSSS